MENILTTAIAPQAASQAAAQAAAPGSGPDTDNGDPKINAAAQEFEAVFLTELLKPMFEGIKTNGLLGGGKGEEVFRGFLLQEYGKIMARAGGLGLADHVRNEMIRIQTGATGRAETPAAAEPIQPTVNKGEPA